jgi:hypothetical protein
VRQQTKSEKIRLHNKEKTSPHNCISILLKLLVEVIVTPQQNNFHFYTSDIANYKGVFLICDVTFKQA